MLSVRIFNIRSIFASKGVQIFTILFPRFHVDVSFNPTHNDFLPQFQRLDVR